MPLKDDHSDTASAKVAAEKGSQPQQQQQQQQQQHSRSGSAATAASQQLEHGAVGYKGNTSNLAHNEKTTEDAKAVATHYESKESPVFDIKSDPSEPSSKSPLSGYTGDDEEADTDVTPVIAGSMTKIKFYFILVGLACSLFLSAIDSTIVATAMPKILEEFKQFQSISLPSVAYMLALCTLAPIYGRLSDILGRKPVILSAIVLCVAGSVMCGAAKSFTVLTVGRAIQGAGGAGMFALPLILIADLSPPRQASVYISLMGVVVALSTVMGPILGGAFAVSETLTWRSSFYLNGPVGFVAVVILFFFLHIPPMHRPSAIEKRGSVTSNVKPVTVWTRLGTLDYGGAFIFVVAMTCLLLAFSWGGLDYPWSDKIIIILLCVGIVMTVVFVIYEIKVAKDPLIPMRLFRNRNLVIAILVNVSIGVAMYGTVYYIPLYWAYVHQLDSVQSGLRLLPFMLSVSLSSGVCGAICSKRGYYRWFIRIGAVLMCAFFTSLKVIETDKYTLGMHIGLLVGAGIGVGMCFQPATVAAQAAVEPEDMAVATTLLSFFRTVAAVIGLSVQNSILFNKLGNLLKEAIMEAGGQLPGGLPAGAAVDASEILKGGEEVLRQLPKEQFAIFAHAFTKALGWVFLGTMPFVAIGIFASVFMKHIPLRSVSNIDAMANKNKKSRRRSTRRSRSSKRFSTMPEFADAPQVEATATATAVVTSTADEIATVPTATASETGESQPATTPVAATPAVSEPADTRVSLTAKMSLKWQPPSASRVAESSNRFNFFIRPVFGDPTGGASSGAKHNAAITRLKSQRVRPRSSPDMSPVLLGRRVEDLNTVPQTKPLAGAPLSTSSPGAITYSSEKLDNVKKDNESDDIYLNLEYKQTLRPPAPILFTSSHPSLYTSSVYGYSPSASPVRTSFFQHHQQATAATATATTTTTTTATATATNKPLEAGKKPKRVSIIPPARTMSNSGNVAYSPVKGSEEARIGLDDNDNDNDDEDDDEGDSSSDDTDSGRYEEEQSEIEWKVKLARQRSINVSTFGAL